MKTMLDDTSNLPAMLASLPDMVDEYNARRAALDAACKAFDGAIGTMNAAVCVGGTYGGQLWDRTPSSPWPQTAEAVLLASAWKHVYAGLNIEKIASAKDRSQFATSLEKPPEFTLDNIRATFADYVGNSRFHILKGLAEAFADLDPAYKSHSKVRVGVTGLPKRVVINNIGSYFSSYGWDKIRDIINALAGYQGKPHVDGKDMAALRENGDALRVTQEVPDTNVSTSERRRRKELGEPEKTVLVFGRGIWLKTFKNGNGHLFFDVDALRDINMALAEFYGEVLPDMSDDDEPKTKRPSTAVSKDLQYYPTPQKVIDQIFKRMEFSKDDRVLEPSCGDGRIMQAVIALNKTARVQGIEVDPGRANEARGKGLQVQVANFLEVQPAPIFDKIIMNPPFSGKHYLKHLIHAIKFLKPATPECRWGAGQLICILPASAHYDHGLLPEGGEWTDLPVASFSESGTNIPTGYVTYRGASVA